MTISDEIRSLVEKNFLDGYSKVEISKLLKISERSVYRILSKDKVTNRVSKRKKNTEVRTACIKRAYSAVRRSGFMVSSKKIKQKIPLNLSTSSIKRYLRNLRYKYKKVIKKIILTKEQKDKRVKIVRNWIRTKLDPDLVVFTDESRFSLDGNDSMYSWMDKNDFNLERRPFGGGSVMVWGAILKSGKIILRRIVGTLNSEKYCSLMENDILPLLNNTIRTYIFQQDNASCHVSKKSLDMFERHNTILLEWPPKSPDLSLIEQLWSILKTRIYDGTIFNNFDELWNRINVEALKIQQETPDLISRLWNNYSDKMCDVLCTNGCLLK